MRQQLLRSPYFQPALSSSVLVAVYGTLISKDAEIWQAHAAAAACSGDGGGAGRQQQSQEQQDAQWKQAAWDMACARHDALPACHNELLRLAGCSSKALLWAATEDPDAHTDVEILNSISGNVIREYLGKNMAQQGADGYLGRDMAAAFLRPLVLLHWAWHFLAADPDQLAGAADPWVLRSLWSSIMTYRMVQSQLSVTHIKADEGLLQAQADLKQHQKKLLEHRKEFAEAALTLEHTDLEVGRLDAMLAELDATLLQNTEQPEALQAKQETLLQREALESPRKWIPELQGKIQQLIDQRRQLIEGQQAVVQQLQQQRERDMGQAGRQGSKEGSDPEGTSPAPFFLQIVDDALELACKFLTLLLPLVGRSQAAVSAGSGSSHGGSSTQHHEQLQRDVERCLSALMILTEILSGSAQTHCTCAACQPDSACLAACQRGSSVRRTRNVIILNEGSSLHEDAAVWFEHAAQLCAALETYVRIAATTPAVGKPGERDGFLVDCLVELLNPNVRGLRGVLLQAAAAAGSGSKEQQQLYGLLRSMVKWAGMLGPQQQGSAENMRTAVAVTAANMLAELCRVFSAVNGAGGGAATAAVATAIAAGSPTGYQDNSACQEHNSDNVAGSMSQASDTLPVSTQAAAVVPAGASAAGAAAAAASNGVWSPLPWWWLLAACCLQWSQQLALLPPDNSP